MKTQSFLQILFIFLGIFLFHLDVVAQNDTTNDPWTSTANGHVTYHNRDTSNNGGSQRIGIGLSNYAATDLHIQTSGPEHGLMVQGGRLGFGDCNGFQQFMSYERDETGHCRGNLLFWTDESLNGQPQIPTEKMVFTSRGGLGINIPHHLEFPHQYKFAVNGKAIITDLEIALYADWGDYVFDDNYQLLTIDERTAYYKAYKKLPNFKSAEEMDGKINVQDITTRQQVAIEENAIYISQLHEENKALKKEVKEMKDLLQLLLEK